MTAEVESWEHRLLARALEALHGHVAHGMAVHNAGNAALVAAYRHCAEVTRAHSKTFFLASRFLPPAKRDAIRALYAFCRVSDDIVDEAQSHAESTTGLEAWRQLAAAPHPPADQPVLMAWADARARYRIPGGYARQLIDGVARDLYQTRYDTFADLAEYAYGVASTVGLMAMHIIGYRSSAALGYAVRLGVALQITNVLRDVGEDWRRGRVYLPQDELSAFGLSDADIAAGQVTDDWRAFMRFQIARIRRLYDNSWPGLALLDGQGRFAIAAAIGLYRAILDDIERHDYDVFSRRASLSARAKLARLPGIWWRSRAVRA